MNEGTANGGLIMSRTEILYIFSAIFNYLWNLFYCAQDIVAVVCPLIYQFATRTAQRFSGGSHFESIVWTERTCFASRGSGGYYPRSSRCLCALDVSHMSIIVTSWPIFMECDV